MSSDRIHPLKSAASLLATFLLFFLIATPLAIAADPLGATLHKDGTTTFRVWAPFVDSVAVKINDTATGPLSREPGHSDAADTVWIGTAPAPRREISIVMSSGIGASTANSTIRGLNNSPDSTCPTALACPGMTTSPNPSLSIPSFDMPAFTEPTFNTMVIYEMHIGTFNNTFAGAVQKLDYLKNLGINAVEVLPITQNPLFSDHTPADHDWGYDPVQLFAIKSKYGTPREFKEFVKQCHQRQIAVIVDVVYNHLVGNNLLNDSAALRPRKFPAVSFSMAAIAPIPASVRARTIGRPQVRQYINDNALLLLRDYGVDGLRFDDTIDMRTFGPGRAANNEGAELLREINSSYRNTDPSNRAKSPSPRICKAPETSRCNPARLALEFNSQWDDTMVNVMRDVVTQSQRFGSRPRRR